MIDLAAVPHVMSREAYERLLQQAQQNKENSK